MGETDDRVQRRAQLVRPEAARDPCYTRVELAGSLTFEERIVIRAGVVISCGLGLGGES
ncbi:MAG: hypothetical protein ABSG43_13440 [Solirubrobacteraceae bacterium]